MIRHKPSGSGHPYAPDTDQRWPVYPVAGETLRLGAKASSDIVEVAVELEWSIGGVTHSETLSLTQVPRSERGQQIDGGHLASAQAKLARATGGWQVELTPRPGATCRYRFVGANASGKLSRTRWFGFTVFQWQSAPDAVSVVSDGQRSSLPTANGIEILTDGRHVRRVRFSLPLAASEHVAGLGERFDAIDHRGTTLDSVVFEQYKSQGAHRKTYMPMPFAHVVGGGGWGFHVRTSRRVWFDIGSAKKDRLIVELEAHGRSSDDALVEVAIYQGTPAQVLDQFLNDTGRPTELPDWVFRLWASSNEWNTQAEVERQMALHREHDIPVGSVVIEAWSDESTFTIFRDAQYQPTEDGSPHRLSDFTFPADGAWPDPKAMVDELHANDIKVHLWQIPLIKMRPHPTGQARADADAAIAEDVLLREVAPDGSLRPYRNRGWWFPLSLMPDLRDPRAARWWTEKRRYLVEEIGIDGFKTDGGEHAWGHDVVSLDGMRGDEANNLFPVAYAKAYGDLLRSCGKAPVTFSRAGFTGSQSHGAFWAGDENSTWDAFRWSMFAGLNASACGILYWGWDIAGFSGDLPSAELYIRAMTASVFVPIMQYHSEFNHHRRPLRDRTPWNVAEQTGDDRVISMTRELVHLRERLVGYLSGEAEHAIEAGAPLMRALYFDHPNDAQVWDHPLQWMLGRDLLVAPVLEPGVEEWDVYLPQGEWVNAWDAQRLTGGRVLTMPAPLGRVPVLITAEAAARLLPVFGSDA